MATLETPDFVMLFVGALAASCLAFGALSMTFAWLTAAPRLPFPAPYRAITAPVKRHRRPAELPQGFCEFAAAHAVLRGVTA